jgi:hypothetical protein
VHARYERRQNLAKSRRQNLAKSPIALSLKRTEVQPLRQPLLLLRACLLPSTARLS